MSWLFKRKKVADTTAITPCVCDNGSGEVESFSLQDMGGSSEPPTELYPHNSRKGYQRLERPPEPEGEETESSTESSNDFESWGGFADTDDEDEELSCNVCERSFRSVRKLEQHQQRRRHYDCCVCEALFPTLMALELHKETLDHWSDYELRLRRCIEEEELRAISKKRGRDGIKTLLL